MFTGIVQDIGKIISIDKSGDWKVVVETSLPLANTAIGASIACSGICLTVVEKNATQFKVQLSEETLSKTTAIHWRVGTAVNLEPALKMGDELGGHLLSGHVDGLAQVVSRQSDGDSWRLMFEVPAAFAPYIAAKGSIALDGISLTINEVDQARFGINVIPHTQKATTIGQIEAGDEVNFEIDMIARYVKRMLDQRAI